MRNSPGRLASLFFVLSSGCGSTSSSTAAAPLPMTESATSAVPVAAARPAACGSLDKFANASSPMRNESSTIALRREGEALLAYVADPDALTIDVIDVHARRVLSANRTSGPVEQVMFLPSGHLAATLRDGSYLEVFAPGAKGELRSACSREVPPGSFAMAQSLDGTLVGVTSRTAGTVTLLGAEDLAPRRVIGLPRAPAGVVFEDGALYVSHLVGAQVSIVDLTTFGVTTVATTLAVATNDSDDAANFRPTRFDAGVAKLNTDRRTASQAYSLVSVELRGERDEVEARSARAAAPKLGPDPKKAVAPSVAAAPTKRVVVPMISIDAGSFNRPTSHYYGPPQDRGVPKQAHVGFLIDPHARAGLSRHVVAERPELAREPCYAPRGSAFDPETESLFVTCVGTDTLLELDARSSDPMRAVRHSYRTPRGPTGVAIAETERLAVVMASFEGRVSIIDLAKRTSTIVDIDVPLSAEGEKHLVGKQLFYRANDRALSFDGLACASCHVEGGEDGVSWMTPIGPRQTLMLAGRLAHSAPFGWDRDAKDLDQYVGGTVDRLGGEGISETQRTKLIEYISALPAPPIGVVEASKRIEGQALFEANGCNECHAGGASNSEPYDVGDDKPFDTPSLQRVSLSAPYYHDGRYATLEQLLRDKSNKMGRTAELDERAIVAIEHYLKSL